MKSSRIYAERAVAALFVFAAVLVCTGKATAQNAGGEGLGDNSYGAEDTRLKELIEALEERYLCPVSSYLTAIQEKPMTPHERFLILWAQGREEFYVQCLFFDNDRQIVCEAASGYYYGAIKGYARGAKQRALAELGFSTDDSKGNFVQDRRADQGNIKQIAKMLIDTLVRVFDLRIGDRLEYYAPLLSDTHGKPVERDDRCPVPVS